MKRKVRQISADELRLLLDYDSATGAFTRRVSRRSFKAGSRAGCHDSDGYIVITIYNRLYKAHRLAWLWMTGEWPRESIDHKNGIRDDNRWCNLRQSTMSENCHNVAVSKRNTSGYLGVTLHKPTGRWRALIGLNGKQRLIGSYSTADEAYAAYLAEKARLHPSQPVPRSESRG